MKSFIVCTTQRSGSSLLCEVIKTQNQLGSPGESLLYYDLPRKKLGEFRIKLKDMSLEDALKELIAHTSSKNNISSMKVMMSTLEVILKKFDKNILDSKEFYTILKKNYNNPSFIFLKRRDKIKQAISQAYLLKTKTAHIETEEESLKLKEMKKNIKLTLDEIVYRFEYILKEELKWKLFFLTNRINPHTIYFEDFLKDREAVLNNLAKILNIDFNYIKISKEPFIKTSDSTQQQLEDDLYTYILANYSESALLEYGIKLSDFNSNSLSH